MKSPRAILLLKLSLLLAGIGCHTTSVPAYEVWTGTCKTPASVVNSPEDWNLVADSIKGLNSNFAPGSVDNPSPDEWAQILSLYTTGGKNVMQEWGHPDDAVGTVTEAVAAGFLTNTLSRSTNWGYTLKHIMIYDMGGADGKINTWKDDEVQNLRTALDSAAVNRPDIGIIYNARSFNAGKRMLTNSLIVAGLNEGSTGRWFENAAERKDLLRWFTTNSLTRNKPFIFQITLHHDYNDGNTNGYDATRRLLRAISAEYLGSTDWIRSTNAIILPLTYPDFAPHFPFLPEHNVTGDSYGDSATGLLLSLIEQKDLFEGRAPGGLISLARCYSRDRHNYFTAVADGNLSLTNTWGRPLPATRDAHEWFTGPHTVGADGAVPGSTTVFDGETLVVSTNGTLAGNVAGVTFQMRNLVLHGGRIEAGQNSGLVIDLRGNECTLSGGWLRGGSAAGQHVRIQNGTVAGDGTIAIEALGPGGGQVEFANGVNLANFRGTFDVRSNGILNLPSVPLGSFSLKLSGTGRYANDTNIVLNSLEIAGVRIPGGVYYHTNFTVAQRAYLVNTTGKISVIGDATAIANGNLNNPAVWVVGPPTEGDENTWKTGAHALGGTGLPQTTTTNFFGGTLVVSTNGSLNSSASRFTLLVNNLVLDGGTISHNNTYPFVLDLTGHTLTLNSGTIKAGLSDNFNRNLRFQNGRVNGGGMINVTVNGTGRRFEVELKENMDLSGFTGVFNVVSNGTLTLSSDTIQAASFGVRLSSNGLLQDEGAANLLLASLAIEGVSFPEGTYHHTDFTPEQQACFWNTNQTLTVVDAEYARWAFEHEELIGGKYDDDDGDGVSNYGEFAQGGDPTDPADTGRAPGGGILRLGDADWFEFVHAERKPSPNGHIRYFVERTDNLEIPVWTANGVVRVGSVPMNDDYNLVTDRVNTAGKSQQFIRLRIE